MRCPSRKLRLVRIEPTHLLDMLINAGKDLPQFVRAIKMSPLPDDASVISVNDDPWSRSIVFVVHSESFAEVPEGEMIPDLEGGPRELFAIDLRQPQADAATEVDNG